MEDAKTVADLERKCQGLVSLYADLALERAQLALKVQDYEYLRLQVDGVLKDDLSKALKLAKEIDDPQYVDSRVKDLIECLEEAVDGLEEGMADA